MQVLAGHEQFLHCRILHRSSNLCFFVSFVYGLHTVTDRQSLWADMTALQVVNHPWVILGDFNFVLCPENRLNGAAITSYETKDFQLFVDSLLLTELKFTGPYYTWCNKGLGTGRISSKIDWCFGNVVWMQDLGHIETLVLHSSFSDHSPLLLDFKSEIQGRGRPFRFLNVLASHATFDHLVTSSLSTPVDGTPMYRVWTKLQACKKVLKILHAENFRNSDIQIEAAKANLEQVQAEIQLSPHSRDLHVKEQHCMSELKHWTHVSESILRQKARATWLQLGDSNSHYFFAAMKHRQNRNKLVHLSTSSGDILTHPDDI